MLGTVLTGVLTGCGTPGAPLPPSLNLPDRVADLAAVRSGKQVDLTWTMPKRNTDKILLKSDIAAHLCRRAGSDKCEPVGDVTLAPGSKGKFSETLPSALATGPSRAVSYFVELRNRNGRSAGLSNAATVVGGQAPGPVTGLAAELRKDGIVLRWDAADGDDVRLRRTLLSAAVPKPKSGPLAAVPEPVEQNLLVPAGSAALKGAVDQHIVWGQTYEYRAQRVARMTVDGQVVELDGELSAPVRIEAADVFPPAVPTGLAAVAVGADKTAGTPPSIDLNWEPNTEPDLAGYEVYRREDMTPWQRISGDQPVAGPAFHDAQVLPGHTYRYGVSAVDRTGHESGRSAEAQDTVPGP